MMVLDQFKTEEAFPFDHYFESSSQYANAMRYWLAVLRTTPHFREGDWMPRERPVDIKQDMYLGKVIDILSPSLRKEINLQTISIAGDVNVLLRENAGVTPEDYRSQKELFGKGFVLTEQALTGLSPNEALEEAEDNARRNVITAWVEKAVHWETDPKDASGGREVFLERLVLTSPISAQAERLTLHILDLFLQPGPAIDRVNHALHTNTE